MPKETQHAVAVLWKPDRQCTYDVTLRQVCAASIAAEEQ
jgi:hypothetical protein